MQALIAGLFTAALLTVAGCGNSGAPSKAQRRSMNANLAVLEFRLSADVVGKDADLPVATDAYIAAIRKYRNWLGTNRAKQKLVDAANKVQSTCGDCAAELDRERDAP